MSGLNPSGLSDPAQRRAFLRHVVDRTGHAINGAHLFLAAILAKQDQGLFARPFARTVFTTNFDPLLQRSLQLAHRLYYMTDQPDLGFKPEDEDTDALHLVYLHGSIHRYRLLNTAAELAAAKTTTPAPLRSFVERHGLIVLGYGGWDDAVMTALAETQLFDGNLYWCDRHSPESAEDLLPDSAVRLLRRLGDNAFYVPINDGSSFMAELHRGLDLGSLPEFVVNPIPGVIEELKAVDLATVSILSSEGKPSEGPTGTPPGNSYEQGVGVDRPDLERLPALETVSALRDRTVTQLEAAQQYYLGLREPAESLTREPGRNALEKSAETAALMNEALLAWFRGDHAIAGSIWEGVSKDAAAPPSERVRARFNHALALERLGKPAEAVAEYTMLVSTPAVPSEVKATALMNRGVLYSARGDKELAHADFSAVVELSAGDPGQNAQALNNRGLAKVEQQQIDAGLADFSDALRIPDVPSDQRAITYFNRATTLHQVGRNAEALQAFAEGLKVEGAPEYLKARLLYNRAVVVGKTDQRAAISDYDQLLQFDSLTPFERVRALHNRAVLFGQLGEDDRAIADYTRAIETSDSPLEDKLTSLLARAQRRHKAGLSAEAVEDYEAVVGLESAPAEMRQAARLNLAIILKDLGQRLRARVELDRLLAGDVTTSELQPRARLLRGQLSVEEGQFENAIADADAALRDTDVPELRQLAFAIRGWARFSVRPTEPASAREDFLSALDLNAGDGVTRANLALVSLREGRIPEALAEYERAAQDLTVEKDLQEILSDLTEYAKGLEGSEQAQSVLETRLRRLRTSA